MSEIFENVLFPLNNHEIIKKALDKYGLPQSLDSLIEQLIEKKRSTSSLICCNGGCDVCNDSILNCYDYILSNYPGLQIDKR